VTVFWSAMPTRRVSGGVRSNDAGPPGWQLGITHVPRVDKVQCELIEASSPFPAQADGLLPRHGAFMNRD
jgi:hypothetical protein